MVDLFHGLHTDGVGWALCPDQDLPVLILQLDLDAVLVENGVLVYLKRIHQHLLLSHDQGIRALDDLWSFTAYKADKWYESPL